MLGQAEKSAFTAAFARVGHEIKSFNSSALHCIAAAALAVNLAACASGPLGGSADAVNQSHAAAQSYRLSAGDKVRVAVFNEDNLTGEYVVAPDGMVSLPLAGGVQAAGLTLPEFQQAVATKLKDGFVQDPNVTVTAEELRPYYILGEVNKPGKYSYSPDLTVLNAVATAEGFTYRADMSAIYVRHANDPAESEVPLTATTSVLPGDTIRVTQRYF